VGANRLLGIEHLEAKGCRELNTILENALKLHGIVA